MLVESYYRREAMNNPNKPDFTHMSLEELRAYVLNHRDDTKAFYVYCDRRRQGEHAQQDARPSLSR